MENKEKKKFQKKESDYCPQKTEKVTRVVFFSEILSPP